MDDKGSSGGGQTIGIASFHLAASDEEAGLDTFLGIIFGPRGHIWFLMTNLLFINEVYEFFSARG